MTTTLPRRTTNPHDRAPMVLDTTVDGRSVTLPGLPEQATEVRSRLAVLTAALPVGLRDSIQLLASELFNNAIRHTASGLPGGEVTVTLVMLPDRVQVRVIDDGQPEGELRFPVPRPPDVDSEGGFGLFFVHTTATQGGTAWHADGRTSVWFELSRSRR